MHSKKVGNYLYCNGGERFLDVPWETWQNADRDKALVVKEALEISGIICRIEQDAYDVYGNPLSDCFSLSVPSTFHQQDAVNRYYDAYVKTRQRNERQEYDDK